VSAGRPSRWALAHILVCIILLRIQEGCAKYCDERFSMFVCLSVCLPARVSQKLHVQTSRILLYMLSAAVTRSCVDDIAIRYVLPVLWMTSYFT